MIRRINGVNARIPSANGETSAQIPNTLIYLDYVFIAGGTIKVGDTFWLRSVILKSGTSYSCTGRLYWNTSYDVSGATQLAQFTISAATRHCAFQRRIHFPSDSVVNIMRTTYDSLADVGDFTTGISAPSVTNWITTDGYFFITIDFVGRVTDTVRTLYISVEI